MKLESLVAASLPLVFFAAGYAQTPDKAKCDQILHRLKLRYAPLLNPFPGFARDAAATDAIPAGT